MKLLFLLFHGFSEHSGISKKIRAQINGLRENGHDVRLCYYTTDQDGNRKRMIDSTVLEDYGLSIGGKIKHRIFFGAIVRYIIDNDIKLVYMRSIHNANPFTIYFVNQLKRKGVKVVMEIPTFPYDNEYKEEPLKYKLELLIDQLFRHWLVKQLEGVVTFSNAHSIFGGRTINISNGIDFSQIKLKSRVNNTAQQLHLIGVAEVHYWHGFDRLIRGLGNYYKNGSDYKVYFHLVGGLGPLEKGEYEQLVLENKIEEYVFFHGTQFGEELDELFEKSDMGIGSLARHRSRISNIKTLKNREYAARGIPFIYSEIDDDFESMPYVLKAIPDESAICMDEIIQFYNQCVVTPLEIRESITHLSWKEQMKQVLHSVFN